MINCKNVIKKWNGKNKLTLQSQRRRLFSHDIVIYNVFHANNSKSVFVFYLEIHVVFPFGNFLIW